MKLFTTLILALSACLSFGQKSQGNFLSFLHTSGQDIVNEKGQKIFLRGVGLGNWLLPEGYMLKFGKLGDRPRNMEKMVTQMIGSDQAAAFWKTYRKNYITEEDIKRIAALGFNSVRPALNARLFLSEGDHPEFVEEGFELLDSLVTWCKRHKLYVIIDMHAAPGGQTGANIDDSRNDQPELFINPLYQDQLVKLWLKIAEKYKGEPVIAAYDLLNEPLPKGSGAAEKYKHLLVPLYQRLTSEIRKVDPKHMITLEGFDWSNDWSLFDKPFDNNVFYQFHYYSWARPDRLGSIEGYLKKRNELNTPVWVGETGEKGNAIHWASSQILKANNIGFSFWPWKKMDTENTPYSIHKPANWDLIAAYSREGPKPDSMLAAGILYDLLENIKIENCTFLEDVCNSILTRVPGKIEAENYGHYGYNVSYYVTDTVKKAEYYRINEPVPILLDSKDKEQFWSDQSIVLKASEWVVYYFDCPDGKGYQLSMKAAATMGETRVIVQINGKSKKVRVASADFSEFNICNLDLKEGENTVKVMVQSGQLKMDWIRFDNAKN